MPEKTDFTPELIVTLPSHQLIAGNKARINFEAQMQAGISELNFDTNMKMVVTVLLK